LNKLKYWGVATIIGVLIGAAFWWIPTKVNELKDPLNNSDAYVFSDNGILYWFELNSKSGKIEGKLHQQRFIETAGKAPTLEEKIYPLTGETTKERYFFEVKNGTEMVRFKAWFTGPHLSVQKQGEKDSKLYNPVNLEELDSYVKALQDYHTEERENNQRREFFTALRNVYGYLYSARDSSFQLFVKIDEALLEGELTGSLLMIDDEGKETRYPLNGVTDGNMLRLFTTVDKKTTKLDGIFHEGATELDLSFWMTDQMLTFHAVTEEEFIQSYEEMKN
jgi:hypothetical protein